MITSCSSGSDWPAADIGSDLGAVICVLVQAARIRRFVRCGKVQSMQQEAGSASFPPM